MRDLDHKIYSEDMGWVELPIFHGHSRVSDARWYAQSLAIRGRVRPNKYSLVRLKMETTNGRN